MVTKEWAIAYANKLRKDYPQLSNANAIIEKALNDGILENETEMLAVWGRLMKGNN